MNERKQSTAVRVTAWICALLFLTLFAPAALSEETTGVTDIQKYGNILLSISADDFLALGYEPGDLVRFTIMDHSYTMPVGNNYSDVDEGSMICRIVQDETEQRSDVLLAINMGDLATHSGLARKIKTEEEPGYIWQYTQGTREEQIIRFAIAEKRGYLSDYLLRQLSRSNRREDYPQLTDAQFANFRPVETTGMGKGVLYRSSSPVDPQLGRNRYADKALQSAGVRTVINLADTAESMRAYPDYAQSAYAGCNVIPLNLGIDIHSEAFQSGLADGMRHLAKSEGPYLIHCTEGKDRAGFVCALLELLMGAAADEAETDYMLSFVNYYGVLPGSEQYEAVAESNIRRILASSLGIESIYDPAADLAALARKYMTEKLCLTAEEIDRIIQNLSGDAL